MFGGLQGLSLLLSLLQQPRQLLLPAVMTNGQVFPGQMGETHGDVINRVPEADRDIRINHGFIDNRGNFLSREQAREAMNAEGWRIPTDAPHSMDLPDMAKGQFYDRIRNGFGDMSRRIR